MFICMCWCFVCVCGYFFSVKMYVSAYVCGVGELVRVSELMSKIVSELVSSLMC